jgi:hypothetical protein
MCKRSKVFFVLFVMLFFSFTGYYRLTAKTPRKFINCGNNGDSKEDCIGLSDWCHDYRIELCNSDFCRAQADKLHIDELEYCEIVWDDGGYGGGGGGGDYFCAWDPDCYGGPQDY